MAWIYDFDAPPPGGAGELTRLLGGKGANLVIMRRDLGLPVPPGFVVTTEACREFLAGSWPAGLDEELRAAMGRLGAGLRRRFGDESDPLLVSVRSGAPVSMPGMMDTILNLGLTQPAVRDDFTADCMWRLAESWDSVVGGDPPDDVWTQLRAAVEAVFNSWLSERARAYRRRESIADDLGTAVTVQAMVFGNRGADSGTGVVFTRDPSTGEKVLFGDVMFDAQGEDVVAGTHATEPIAVLESRLPEVAAELRRHAEVLERHYRDMCDIEFTIEDGRLWMLQVRVGKRSAQAALRMAVEMADDPAFPLSRREAVERVADLLADPPRTFVLEGELPEPIARGLPASPGVASGAVVLSPAEVEHAAGPVILVRSETSPEDVPAMARSAGILTESGGLASHAAVVARGWGIPAVVGAGALGLAGGETITIDGSTGSVYAGELTGRWEVVPEVGKVLDWAGLVTISAIETGSSVAPAAGRPAGRVSTHASRPNRSGLCSTSTHREPASDDVLRTLAVKGTAPLDVEPDALVERTDDGVRLTAAGRQAAATLFAADAAAIGEARGLELLNEFHRLDERMKLIVTAWQIRQIDGAQALNDHTDASYDAGVLDDLSDLHAVAAGWLERLEPVGRRFTRYRERLSRAVELARTDQRFVASPRVDSYHTVWFELHEDLIRTTGRTRQEEAAAGRA